MMMKQYFLLVFDLISAEEADVIRTSGLTEADNSDDIVRDIWSIDKL